MRQMVANVGLHLGGTGNHNASESWLKPAHLLLKWASISTDPVRESIKLLQALFEHISRVI